MDSINPNLIVNAIIGVSTFLSFYGHLLFYNATRGALRGHDVGAKFVCIIAVLVLCGLQGGILETLVSLKVVPGTPPFSVQTRSQRESSSCDRRDQRGIGWRLPFYSRHFVWCFFDWSLDGEGVGRVVLWTS